MKYIKELDSIRTFAVMLVVIHHWLSESNVLNALPNGEIGVNAFFVLSGFLISRILFENRKKINDQGNQKLHLIKNFVIRRTLRIFPIYYITIFLLLIFANFTDTSIRENIVYYLTYTSNFFFYSSQQWDGILSHLWSLAVEEQFYIFWPWLMIFVPRKWLPYTIIAFITLGITANFFLPAILGESDMTSILTPTVFDSFGFGALYAWVLSYRPDLTSRLERPIMIIGLLAFITMCIQVLAFPIPIPLRTLISLFSLSVIVYCLTPRKNWFYRKILGNNFLVELGKMSYGMYLFHNIIPFMYNKLLGKFIYSTHIPVLDSVIPQGITGELEMLNYFLLLLIISYLSWNLIEKPINGLKRLFEYQRK